MIKAVLFDVGSTLIEPDPEIDGVFCEVAEARGHEVDPAAVAGHMPTIHRFYEDEYLRDGDFWCSPEGSVEIYLDMYRYLSHLTGLEHDAEELAQGVNQAFLQARYWKIYDDVLPCLKALKRGHLTLGIVSNWSPNLTDLMRGLYLAPYFDEIVSSADVGYRKPDPMIFTIMLERLNLSPEEVLHVGDRPDADGEGAAAAGIRPIIIDRDNRYPDSGYTTIESLALLPDLVNEIAAGNAGR